jgi:hypothetical protein
VLVRSYRDEPIPAKVTRTSWALNVKSRTLRAEIDLPNTDTEILPGAYAYGKVHIERTGIWSLPVTALTYSGDKTFYWSYKDGKSVRTEIQTGVSDGEYIEITNRMLPGSKRDDPWTPIDGKEQVISAQDLGILAEGSAVRIESDKANATP